MWSEVIWAQVAGPYEDNNEISDSVKRWAFLGQLSDCQLLKG
jgi:hypothetical protein